MGFIQNTSNDGFTVGSMSHRNKLLFVSYWAPYPIINGATLRMHNLLINLGKKWNIDLICPTPKNKDDVQQINNYYNAPLLIDLPVSPANKDRDKTNILRHVFNLISVPNTIYALNTPYFDVFHCAVKKVIRERQYDAILAFTSLTYGYYLSDIKNKNISCDVCDSVSLLFRSMIERSESFWNRMSLLFSYIYNIRWEKKHLNKCKKLIVISERDRIWLSKTTKDSMISVVENGVDFIHYNPEYVKPGKEDGLIVFTGVMSYPPNHDAMMYCIKNIWPKIKSLLPDARLRIVGRNPKPELLQLASDENKIEVTGEVPDIRDALKGATVYLCPILGGAGMKNKILEAFAMGIPVITTHEGCNGIDFEHGKVGYIAETPEEFAVLTEELVKNRDKWEKLSRTARELIESRYSWGEKSEKLSHVLLR